MNWCKLCSRLGSRLGSRLQVDGTSRLSSRIRLRLAEKSGCRLGCRFKDWDMRMLADFRRYTMARGCCGDGGFTRIIGG